MSTTLTYFSKLYKLIKEIHLEVVYKSAKFLSRTCLHKYLALLHLFNLDFVAFFATFCSMTRDFPSFPPLALDVVQWSKVFNSRLSVGVKKKVFSIITRVIAHGSDVLGVLNEIFVLESLRGTSASWSKFMVLGQVY